MCALFTDGRFSGGSSGLVIGHASPEAAEGGTIGLVEDGDVIEIDIPRRKMHLAVSDEVLARRREAMNAREKAWEPVDRERVVSLALQAYAALATSADRGRCGIFRSSSRSVEGLGFEKTAPLWRRFWVFWGLECWRFVRLLSSLLLLLCCCCWCFVERCVLALRGSPLGRGVAAARAHDRGPEPSLRTSLGGPLRHPRCRLRRLPSDSLGRIEVARSRAAPPEGLRLSRDVALLEPWSVARLTSPAETGRAGGRFLHTWWLASWGCWLWRGVPCLAVSVGVCCVACCSPFMRIAVRTLLSQSRLPIHIQWRHILMRREARQHFLRQFLDGFGGGAARELNAQGDVVDAGSLPL